MFRKANYSEIIPQFAFETLTNELTKRIEEGARELAEQIMQKYQVILSQLDKDEKYLIISFQLKDGNTTKSERKEEPKIK